MKTSEIEGAALDWAVAVAEEEKYYINEFDTLIRSFPSDEIYSPSTNWAQGGPIIEREGIELSLPTWRATTTSYTGGEIQSKGDSPLIAAMRCYVASKLGDEIDIPKELL